MDQQSQGKPEAEILYIIPSISVFIPDQFYIFTEAEREYDALAILRIGSSVIPVFIEHSSGRTTEIEKLVKEQRVWPYPTFWIANTKHVNEFMRALLPRLADSRDFGGLLSRHIELLLSQLGHGSQLPRDMAEALERLFKARSEIYRLGTELPLYIQFSSLYLSRATYPCSERSPWDDVKISLNNSLHLLKKGSEERKSGLLSRYASLLNLETEMLSSMGIISQGGGEEYIRRLAEDASCALKDLVDLMDTQHRDSLDAAFMTELRELVESDEIYIVALPQRSTSRDEIRNALSIYGEADMATAPEAAHSLTMAYVVMARLAETLMLIEKPERLKRLVLCFINWSSSECSAAKQDLLNVMRRIASGAGESKNFYEEVEKVLRDVCTREDRRRGEGRGCEEKSKEEGMKGIYECIEKTVDSISKSTQGPGAQNKNNRCSFVFLVIGDYAKEVLQKLTKNLLSLTRSNLGSPSGRSAKSDETSGESDRVRIILENVARSGCRIAVAIAPLSIYRSQERPDLEKIVKPCSLALVGGRGEYGELCLKEYPVGLYIKYLDQDPSEGEGLVG